MNTTGILIANRGEVALRIARTVQDLGLRAVTVFSEDDADSRHRFRADSALPLPGRGVSSYLNIEAITAAARAGQCNYIHPGWGFLSENPDFSAACHREGLVFIGPTTEQLALFGNKVNARERARELGVPVLEASPTLKNIEDLRTFQRTVSGDVILKAVAGGGGRGMQPVVDGIDPEAAMARCRSEAATSFGDDSLYAERFLTRARHIEVQVIGDGQGLVNHLWERDCSLQRRYQKLIEIAPAPDLVAGLRERLIDAALTMARHENYRGLGTFEFLVPEGGDEFYFIEANPRLQVEHTVTEAVTGIDLVAAQIKIAMGASLADIGIEKAPREPVGYAVQLRINAESLGPDGKAQPSPGRIERFDAAAGPGIRVDTALVGGATISPVFDSLAAKLIVHHPDSQFSRVISRALRAAEEFAITGVATNLPLHRAILEQLIEGEPTPLHNRWLEENLDTLLARVREFDQQPAEGSAETPPAQGTGALDAVPAGSEVVKSASAGCVVEIQVEVGATVTRGQTVVITEAMKMHHLVESPCTGTLVAVLCMPGEIVAEGQPLLAVMPDTNAEETIAQHRQIDLNAPRADLDEVVYRHSFGRDENRPGAVAKRHRIGARTARENVEDLCDEGSFLEYGALAIPAQRRRRPVEELMETAPADGMIAGFGTVNAPLFGEDNSRCAVLAYDYSVMAGTQGHFNHKKKDRLFELVAEWEIPTVFYTEGGGGRPGEVDQDDLVMGWLDLKTFTTWPQTSGLAPRIGINHGRCFAGNAVIFGLCDITIATRNSSIGLAGPAMIEGGGLGSFRAEDIGPMDVQTRNGVVDVLCEDEREATAVARQLLGFFQGNLSQWQCEDQRVLRHIVPENRKLAYDMRRAIEAMADTDSVVELRRDFGTGIITALLRIEGRPFGLIANNPGHLGGAIDGEASDKGARFLQLCDTFGLPVVSLCDTPGFMVGPESERGAAVRRGSQLILASANLSVPLFSITLRKGYGVGAQAMVGGSFHRPFFTLAWPTAEFGPMGFEGAVRLGYRKELEAQTSPEERDRLFNSLVDDMYRKGKGVSVAQVFEVDAVIDPADTRAWIVKGLRSTGTRKGRRRSYLNVW